MNPNCPCPTRTCPLHGFCDYCSQHHAELNRALTALGLGEHCHFHHCKQDLMVELHGAEATGAMARKVGEDMIAAGAAARAAGEEDAQ